MRREWRWLSSSWSAPRKLCWLPLDSPRKCGSVIERAINGARDGADTHGHIYVLYPQYGPVADCRMCTAPIMALVVSEDNGISWHSSRPMLPFPTGQFDPQIVVDPVDHQTVYASWLQNDKRDIVVARSLDFGRTWSFSWAERGQEDADKPTLAVHGADVYVGFNHEEKLFVASSHDAGQTFSSVVVNPNAEPGFSLAGGATVDPAGNLYIGWTAYARRDVNNRPVSIYFSRSADGGRAPLDYRPAGSVERSSRMRTGKVPDGIPGTSNRACLRCCRGTLRFVECRRGERRSGAHLLFILNHGGSNLVGAGGRFRSQSSVEHAFPAITAGPSGDVRLAWMDTRKTELSPRPLTLWNTFYRSSTNGGATWGPEQQLSSVARGYDYIRADGFRFPFGDYFGLGIDSDGATHAVWGEGRDYKSPGSIWYTRGR